MELLALNSRHTPLRTNTSTTKPNERPPTFFLSLTWRMPSSPTLRATLKEVGIATEKTVKKMSRDLEYSTLTALSPLDGRYW
ncbi:hypothetical protein PanWU01x14_345100, partial [Parasponia andersonii]